MSAVRNAASAALSNIRGMEKRNEQTHTAAIHCHVCEQLWEFLKRVEVYRRQRNALLWQELGTKLTPWTPLTDKCCRRLALYFGRPHQNDKYVIYVIAILPWTVFMHHSQLVLIRENHRVNSLFLPSSLYSLISFNICVWRAVPFSRNKIYCFYNHCVIAI